MYFKTNLIKKGKRYTKLIPDFISMFFYFGKKTITKYYNFSDGCDYTLNDQLRINKLFGFTFRTIPCLKDMLSPLHIDSCRLGWRYINGKMEIIPYEYKDKKRSIWTPIAKLQLREWYKFEIIIKKKVVTYTIYNNKGIMVGKYVTHLKRVSWFGHYLGIYFGGEELAPNDIYILEK